MNNSKISLRQLQALLLVEIIGTGIAWLPKITLLYAGRAAWAACLCAGVFAAAFAFVMASLASNYSKYNFFEYSSVIIGRPFAVLATLLFVSQVIAASALNLRLFVEAARVCALPRTPLWLTGLGLLLTALFSAGGFEARGRFGEILLIFTVPLLILSLLTQASEADFTELLPVFRGNSPKSLLYGGFCGLTGFCGAELCLLAPRYVNRPGNAPKSAVFAVSAAAVILSAATALCLCAVGFPNGFAALFPALEALNMSKNFLSGKDALFLGVLCAGAVLSVSGALFFCGELLRDMLKPKSRSWSCKLLIAPVVFFAAFLPENLSAVWDSGVTLVLPLKTAVFLAAFLMLAVGKIKGVK
ncbi:MAG: GerAB/ArcD/ProY family transporter [Clostridiales bacterium]|jgi:spore germination protein|nr:GerAB/ArcD/ProY family transporter [Clostridiales bacterium]